MQVLGEHLKKLRKENGYNQKELATKLGVSQQVISNIECGQSSPDLNFLRKAADLYEISLDQLVGRSFVSTGADDLERQIMNYIQHMDTAGKELSLGLVSQVAQYQGNGDDSKK